MSELPYEAVSKEAAELTAELIPALAPQGTPVLQQEVTVSGKLTGRPSYIKNDKDSLKMQLAQTSCKDNTVKVITNENKLPEQIFACPKCSKSFKRGDHLKRHLVNVHDHEHPYHCGECPKGFPSIESLVKHYESAHVGGVSKGPYCAWCGTKFIDVGELEKHAHFMHKKQDSDYMIFINKTCGVFGCSYCQKTVSSEKILKRHIEKMHSVPVNGKIFCMKCNKCFGGVDLDTHNKQFHANKSKELDSKAVKKNHVNGDQSHWNANLPQSAGTSALNNHSKELEIQLHQTYPVMSINMINSNQSRPITSCYKNAMFEKLSSKPSSYFQPGTHNGESSTISEALSGAMKALSDFSYDEFSYHPHEYIPSSYSVFQSSSPIPHFHLPSTVQCTNLIEEGKDKANADNLQCNTVLTGNPEVSYDLSKTFLPSLPANSTALNQLDSNIPQSSSHVTNYATSLVSAVKRNPKKSVTVDRSVEDTDPFIAKRGRPKKKKSEGGTEPDDDTFQNMFIKEVKDGNVLIFNCLICNQIYKGVDNLMHHIEAIHLAENPQRCCICRKKFAQAGNVKRHIRFVHLRERPFQCNDCDSTFDRLCYLQRHMRTHVDLTCDDGSLLTPCTCPECGRKCLTTHHLRGHMQRRHFPKVKKKSNVLDQKYGYLFGEMDGFKITVKPVKDSESKSSARVNGTLQTHCSSSSSTAPNSSVKHVSVNVPKINVQLNNSKSSSYFKSADQSCINESGCFESDESVADSFNSGKTSPHKRFKRKRYQKVGIKKAKQKRLQPILPYKCNHCAGRGFSSLRFLKSHIAVVHHRTMRQHLCHRCGRGFSLKSALVNHMTKRHGKLSIRSRANGKFVKSKS